MWWRDDDAHCDSLKLRRLLKAAQGTPIALAVVPGLMDSTLPGVIDGVRGTHVLQHGWMHTNWSRVKANPSEYPQWRPVSEVKTELRKGRDLLEARFGNAFLPVFVPPWHGCSPWLLRSLPALGYLAVSQDAALSARLIRHSTLDVNIEIDASDWKSGGAFIGVEALTRKILRAFNFRARWNLESPVGLLTHHAFLAPEDFDHLRDCVCALAESENVQWMSCMDVIGEIGSREYIRFRRNSSYYRVP
ncbi:MAG TPA: hypothetical protein VKB38_10725 [Terracidiphilus sp.]|nr:hypothetical protein [Terracidiphilus sp.]